MQHPELPAGGLTALACLLISLPSHIRVRNVASTSMNIWLAMICLVSAVNAFIWADDVIVRYPVWCDITTKLIIGSNVAFPACAFCICRFLCDVAKPNAGEQTAKVKRIRAWVEIVICWVQPLIIMALHYIVQGHRFDIYEFIGCQPTFYDSWPALFIISIPPLVYCLGTFVYAGFAFYYFLQRRRQFEALLNLGNSGMNTNRYLRLMIVATAEMVWGTPFYLFLLVENFQPENIKPWISWDWVHSNWLRVGQYPLSLVPAAQQNVQFALWWMVPVSGYLFFIFFGFSDQGMKDYRAFIRWFRVRILRQDLDRRDAQMRSLARNTTAAQGVGRSLMPRRKEEKFEDFAKTFDIHIPPKAVDEEAASDPDTWAGWVSKVARDDEVLGSQLAATSTIEGHEEPTTSIPGVCDHRTLRPLVSQSPHRSTHSGNESALTHDFTDHQSLRTSTDSAPPDSSITSACCPCRLELKNQEEERTGTEHMV